MLSSKNGLFLIILVFVFVYVMTVIVLLSVGKQNWNRWINGYGVGLIQTNATAAAVGQVSHTDDAHKLMVIIPMPIPYT